jgi:hypothetical protein
MERSDIINHLIKQYNYKSYLEIGYGTGYTFNKIEIEDKVGVDGGNGTPSTDTVVVRMRSEDYFKLALEQEFDKFDIIFIDGSHLWEDVEKDLTAALKLLTDHGSIVMHDCSPPNIFFQERQQSPYVGGWTGDVWKAFVRCRAERNDLEMCVVDTDFGCGVVRFGNQNLLEINIETDLEYSNFDTNRKEWLNLVTPEEFLERHS